jgi:hypothetical protein
VRKALQNLIPEFGSDSKACAVELFESILNYLHTISQECPSRCYAHHVFGYTYCDVVSCNCNSSAGENFSDFIIRSYVTELFQISQNSSITDLDMLLGMSLASQSRIWPCEQCGQMKFLKKVLLQKSKVFSISLIWSESSPKLIQWFSGLIPPVLLLRNLFSLQSSHSDYNSRYIFKGMICFVASHYIAFFYSLRRNVWVEFDDSQVIVIYDWREVLGKVMKGRMMPVLLFYELDAELDRFKREYQLEYIESDLANYLLDPHSYFESFAETLDMDLAGMEWRSDCVQARDQRRCVLF